MDRPPPPPLWKFCCDVLLDGQTEWIYRRKEAVELLSESLLKHRVSIDFELGAAPRSQTDEDGSEARLVPLMLLRKEPGRFTRFDFIDEGGRSLPLPNKVYNAAVSGATLKEAARRTLAKTKPAQVVTPALAAELDFIARADTDLALAVVEGAYIHPRGAIATDPDSGRRKALYANPDFRWLLRTLAYSSVVVGRIPAQPAGRRVLKISFEEQVTDVTRVRSRRFFSLIGVAGYRLGWRGYIAEFVSPFVGAQSYHFELHAPEGMQLLEAGMVGLPAVRDNPRQVHLYLDDARAGRTVVPYAQFRIRGPGFVGAAFVTAWLIVLSFVGAWVSAGELADTVTSAPSLMLLFPGLVASYLVRPSHPLVTRLLNLARWTLTLAALLAYIAAAKLAIISHAHPASEQGLTKFFTVLTIISIVFAGILTLTRILPLALSNRARRLARRFRLGVAALFG